MSDNAAGGAAPPEEPGRPRRFRISRRGAEGQGPAPGSFRARYARPGAVMKAVLGTSWRQFLGNVGPLILGSAIWLVPFFYLPAAALRVAPALGVGLWSQAGLLLVVAVVLAPIQAGLANAALRTDAGSAPRVADFFAVPNWGRAVITGIVANVGVFIGVMLYVIPGLAVGIWSMFAVVAAVDRGARPLKAFNTSLELVGRNPVAAMLLGFLVAVAAGLSFWLLPWLFWLLFLPAVIAAAIVALAIVNLYRTLEKSSAS